jgi:hypothetical protein
MIVTDSQKSGTVYRAIAVMKLQGDTYGWLVLFPQIGEQICCVTTLIAMQPLTWPQDYYFRIAVLIEGRTPRRETCLLAGRPAHFKVANPIVVEPIERGDEEAYEQDDSDGPVILSCAQKFNVKAVQTGSLGTEPAADWLASFGVIADHSQRGSNWNCEQQSHAAPHPSPEEQ